MNDDSLRTLAARSAHHAVHRPDHPAVVCEDRQLSYAELHRESNRTAHALRAAGLERGARVAYLGRESEHFFDIALGCAKSGAVVLGVNWRLTAAEIDHILRDSTAELLFVEREFLAVAERVRPELPTLRAVVAIDTPEERYAGFHAWKAGHPDTDLDPGTGPDDAVVQIYTSGTTGLPKGAVIAHRAFFTYIEETAKAGNDWIDWRPDDISLIAFSGASAAGMGWFMHGFNVGATNVVMRQFIASDAVRLVEQLGITTTFVAPAMLEMMLAETTADLPFRSLRKVVYGGAPIGRELLERALTRVGSEFAQLYCSTETGSIVTVLPPADHIPGSPLLGSAGLACPGNEVKITDREGRTLPPGTPGQVCIRTPAGFLGYWNRPEQTGETLVDGWIKMGDAGLLDENGYLFLLDRINDTIIVAGQNIYPVEVENALREHPAVAEAAVVGAPHRRWGESVHAFVVPHPDQRVRARELLLFLRDRLADFKIPTGYDFVDTLPRNPNGKVLRRVLRDELQQRATERRSA